MKRLLWISLISALANAGLALAQQSKLYNTAKIKLQQGKPVVGGTVSTNDVNIYCAMAAAGFDFLWIEMQHSPLTHQDVATMMRACKGTPAIPFIRVPDSTEGDIQKAVDNGALGIIIPMVETVEKAANGVKFAKYPPIGKRSQGGGQYGALWGGDYRQTANDNIVVVAMIESPAGAEIADQIAAVPGIDVVFVASTDLSSFSGLKQGDPKYEAMATKIKEATLKAGKKVGGPHAWTNREGYTFFQAASEPSLIRTGAQAILKGSVIPEGKKGVAPTEGSEKH
jgi:2-keto-3-deoxy-L-rhamnonate aldolase RhmA